MTKQISAVLGQIYLYAERKWFFAPLFLPDDRKLVVPVFPRAEVVKVLLLGLNYLNN